MFDSELTAMATESYERAYGAMITLQELTELEECIEYKSSPERRNRVAVLWSRRIQGIRRDIEHWQKILMLRLYPFLAFTLNVIILSLFFKIDRPHAR